MPERVILSVAAAEHEVETVAACIEALGLLAEATARHDVARVDIINWDERIYCRCGDWFPSEEFFEDHFREELAWLRTGREEDAA